MSYPLQAMIEEDAGIDAQGQEKPGNPWLELVEDGADLQAKELPPVVQVIQGVVAERAKLVICSGSKSYKTWLTIEAALSVAHGVPWLGRETARSKVLYANLELKPDTFARRLQAIADAKAIAIEREWFHHLPLRGRIGQKGIEDTITYLVEICRRLGIRVVVLDPCYKVNTAGEENSSKDQTLFFNQIDRLTTEAGVTVILNDHAGKGNQSEKDPLDVIRGSSAKGGDLDAAFVLRRHETEGCFRVDLVHRELPPVEPFVIGWEYPLMQLRPDLSAEDMKKHKPGRGKAHDPDQLLSAIIDSPTGVSITEWAKKADVKRPTLYNYLSGFRRRGLITTTGEGTTAKQVLTAEGRLLAEQHLESEVR